MSSGHSCEKFSDAEPLLRECLEIRRRIIPDQWQFFNAQMLVGVSLAGQEKWDQAKPKLEAGYAGLKATAETIPASARKKFLTLALNNLIVLATATQNDDALKK